jgi:hypothetical protein
MPAGERIVRKLARYLERISRQGKSRPHSLPRAAPLETLTIMPTPGAGPAKLMLLDGRTRGKLEAMPSIAPPRRATDHGRGSSTIGPERVSTMAISISWIAEAGLAR